MRRINVIYRGIFGLSGLLTFLVIAAPSNAEDQHSQSIKKTDSVLHQSQTSDLFQTVAKQKIQQFSGQLKIALMDAIAEGGFENAVDVCQLQAPKIAANLSTDGWNLRRTSLRTRNPLNQPETWEKEVLLNFEQRAKNGESVNQLQFTDIADGQSRMMKAIPTGQLCIACHGTNISPVLHDKINQRYPHDTAINFSLNDIRGAFSVSAETQK